MATRQCSRDLRRLRALPSGAKGLTLAPSGIQTSLTLRLFCLAARCNALSLRAHIQRSTSTSRTTSAPMLWTSLHCIPRINGSADTGRPRYGHQNRSLTMLSAGMRRYTNDRLRHHCLSTAGQYHYGHLPRQNRAQFPSVHLAPQIPKPL